MSNLKDPEPEKDFRAMLAANLIPQRVVEYCSQDPEDETRLLTLDELQGCSTQCGNVPNYPFTGEVLQYLKAHASPKVLAETWVATKDSIDIKEGQVVIANMAVRWNDHFYNRTNSFSAMVENHGGSLRCEELNDEMWDCYESE